MDSIKNNNKNSFNNLRDKNKTIINRRFKSRDGDEGLLDIWHIDKSLDKKCNTIISNINKNIKQILEDAFNIKYVFINNNVYLNRSVTETRGIHADSHKYPSRIKYFLYFSNICRTFLCRLFLNEVSLYNLLFKKLYNERIVFISQV